MLLVLNFLGLLAALLLSFIAAGMETALYRVSRVRMRIRSDNGDERAEMVLRVLDRLEAMVTTILIDSNAATYAGTYFLTVQLASWEVEHSELITTGVVTVLFFVLTESLPKQLAYNRADMFSMALVRVFMAFQIIFAPMVWVLNWASRILKRLFRAGKGQDLGQSQRTLFMEHLNAGVAEHVLTEEQNSMALHIMQLEGMSAVDSMIPIRRLFLLSEVTKRKDAMREMTRRREQVALLTDALGRPTGKVVTRADLLMRPGGEGDVVEGVGEELEKIRFSESIPDVINAFRRRHARMALVVRGNRVEGLITTQRVLARVAGLS